MAGTQLGQGAVVIVSGVLAIVVTQNSEWTVPGFVLIVAVLVLPLIIRFIVLRRNDDADPD